MATQHLRSQQRGMRFTCDQQWEAMRPEGTDRYCEQCAKPVIDFTAWNRTELKAWYAEHPGTCGMFRIEQVDPGLVPVPELPRGLLNGAMAALAALTLHTAHAQVPAPHNAPTEQTPTGTTTAETKPLWSTRNAGWRNQPPSRPWRPNHGRGIMCPGASPSYTSAGPSGPLVALRSEVQTSFSTRSICRK